MLGVDGLKDRCFLTSLGTTKSYQCLQVVTDVPYILMVMPGSGPHAEMSTSAVYK